MDFDIIFDRSRNHAAKVDELEMRFGRSDLIPLWVADMDFPSPEEVTQAICERATQGIYGYTSRSQTYYDAMIKWYRAKHGWVIDPGWPIHSPTVMCAISILVESMTQPGEGVLIHSPVYNPFYDVILGRGRKVIESHLIEGAKGYTLDLDDLDQKLSGVRLMILCNPHNPVGRVWTKEELVLIGDLCLKHGVRVISDEIHADFVFSPHRYTPFASLSKELSDLTITCLSATKTFNIAGLQASFVIMPRPEEREAFDKALGLLDIRRNNCFSLVAVQAAFEHGERWLGEMLEYLRENMRFVQTYCAREIPEIKPNDPEGTYLLWLDCRDLNLTDEALSHLMIHEAQVALGAGIGYGPKGSGFMRMNVACSRTVLAKAMNQIRNAVRTVRSEE